MKLRIAVMAGLLLGGALSALAEDEPEVDCENAMTQMDMNICAGRDYEEADKALNSQWAVTKQAMVDWDRSLADVGTEGGAAKALVKAQRAWIDYRDGHCEAEGFQVRGGSMEPLIVASCLAELTRQRTEELKDLADGLEN